MVEIINVECPFCGTPIKVLYRLPLVREMKKSSWGGSKKSYTRDEEVMEVIDKCSNCGKTKKEIEKALKEGKQLSHEEIIRRMREAGLPLKIKG